MSLLHPEFQFQARAAAGPGTSRSCDTGDGPYARHQPVVTSSIVAPALEPLSSDCAVASEPGEPGPKAPCLDTSCLTPQPPLTSPNFRPSPPPVLPLPDPEEPPVGHHVLFGQDGARWANPGFTRRPWSRGYGEATVSMTLRSFQAALGEYWRWAHLCVGESKLPARVRKAVHRRALRCPDCGHYWQVPTHVECGFRLTEKARLMEACDSMTCVLCARRRANRRRAALIRWALEHEAQRVKHKLSRDFYVLTWTVPKREYVSVERVQEDATLAFKACVKSWDTVLKYLPKKKGAKHFPGKCDDASMVAFLELGAGGMVHVTALYYGPWHDAKELRAVYQKAVPGGTNFEIRAVGQGKNRKENLVKSVVEVCKYVCKGSVGGKDYLHGVSERRHEYTHPLLCVLAEMALLDRNRVRLYGKLRGVFGKDERNDEGDDEPRAELPAECPGCGAVHQARERDYDDPLSVGRWENQLWEWVDEVKDYAWVPKGWGRAASRPPPRAAPPPS